MVKSKRVVGEGKGGDESWADSAILECSSASDHANISVISAASDGHQSIASRFKHLLEPIRDLALNWNVDIAQDLESYLAELELISISFDGGETKMNFAEAALLIQGSACVYSRKVEHLYKLVFRVLDIIADRQRNAKNDSLEARDGDPEKMFPHEPEFIALDDLQEGKSSAIDLSERDERNSTANLSLMRSPILLTMSLDADIEDASDPNKDLRLASACIHSSGALLLDTRFAGLIDNTFNDSRRSPWGAVERARNSEQSPSICTGDAIGTALNEPDHNANGLCMHGIPEFESEVGGVDDGDEDNLSFYDGDGFNPEEKPKSTTQQAAQQSKNHEHRSDHGPSDLWGLLDPHASGGCKERPFRKGKTFKQPRNQRQVASSNAWPQLSVRCHQTRSLKLPYFPDLSCLFLHERNRRLAQRLAEARSKADPHTTSALGMLMNGEMEDDYDEEDLASLDAAASLDPQGGYLAPPDGFCADQAELDDDDDGAEPSSGCIPGEWPASLGPAATFDSPSGRASTWRDVEADGGEGYSELSYEDMCRKYVEKYLSGVEALLQQSGLAARVNEWQARLAPRLEEEEYRRSFDMHTYGEEMLGRIQSAQERQGRPCDQPAQAISFAHAVEGLQVHDVCRSFLATLQLANDGNVEISLADASDRQSVCLRLVSTHSHHRAMLSDYVAPSLLSARKKKRLKAPASPAPAHLHVAVPAAGHDQELLNSPQSWSRGPASQAGEATGSQASQAATQPAEGHRPGPPLMDSEPSFRSGIKARQRKAGPGKGKENQVQAE